MITSRSAGRSRSGSASCKCRLLALTAAVSLSALLFAACDPKNPTGSTTTGTKPNSVRITDSTTTGAEPNPAQTTEDPQVRELSQEATDLANLRSAYAMVQAAALMQDDSMEGVTRAGEGPGSYTYTATVEATQTVPGWQNTSTDQIAGTPLDEIPAIVAGESWTIVYDEATETTTYN